MKITLNTAYSFCQQGHRRYQEDARYPNADTASGGQQFFVVCDGIGGCDKGEVASQTVCGAIALSMTTTDLTEDFTLADFHHVLDDAYNALDNAVHNDTRDMGTTLTFVCFHAGGCTMAHIGDSRIYQIRPAEGIIYRSDDHSLVNGMVHNGMISPEEGLHHPQRNVITRYMEPVEADQNRCMATVMQTTDIKAGDYFLLCTDGVLHQVSDDDIVDLLISDKSDEEKAKTLAALSEDSEDNNTAWIIVVANVEGNERMSRDTNETTGDSTITKRIRIKSRQLEEIESVPTKNHRLKKWFDKLKFTRK